jgi:hypothetical protein
VSAIDSEGRTIWIADAHRSDGKRLIVRFDEKLTGFSGTGIGDLRFAANCLDGLTRFFPNSPALDGSEAGGGVFPAGFFAPFGTRESQNQHGGEKKSRTMNPLIQLKKVTPLFVVAFACLALLPTTPAVSPAPDGCYPNFATAEGCGALSLLTTGAANTGLGWRSLFSNTTAALTPVLAAER